MKAAVLGAISTAPTPMRQSLDKPTDLSVVVAFSERRDDVRELYNRYEKVLSRAGYSYEFIFVLDGPNAETTAALKSIKKNHPEVTAIVLSRSFGEAAALSVGFEAAKGAIIITLPSYLQVNPPEIHRMLKELLEKEEDLVVGWRHPRIDGLFNRMQSRVFHGLIRLLTGTHYHDVSCGIRVMRRKVAEEISLYGDLHRFFPISAYQRGFHVSEIPVEQSSSDARRRIYSPGVYLRRLLDIVTLFFLFKFTQKPLRFFGLLGSGVFTTGAVITGYLGLERMLGVALAGRPLLILGVLLMVFGAQLFSTGLLGEIIIFTHARQVKDYQIREILD